MQGELRRLLRFDDDFLRFNDNTQFDANYSFSTTLVMRYLGNKQYKKVEVGDVVSSMMLKTAFTVQSSSSRKLLLEFDQTNWKKVRLGDTFRYKIDGDTKEHIGQISKIYSVSNTANRKMKAEVMANDIMVGLYGDGNIITK